MLLAMGNAWRPCRPYSVVPVEGGAAPAADAPAQSEAVRAETRLPTAGVLGALSSALASARAALSHFLDFWLARRPQPQATASSDGVTVAPTTSAAGLVLAFIVRHAMQRLSFILRQVSAARQKRGARTGPDMST